MFFIELLNFTLQWKTNSYKHLISCMEFLKSLPPDLMPFLVSYRDLGIRILHGGMQSMRSYMLAYGIYIATLHICIHSNSTLLYCMVCPILAKMYHA